MEIRLNGVLSLAAGIVFAATGLMAQQGSSPNKMHSGMRTGDTYFARTAATGGMEEVELGRLAVKNGQSDQVKQFGQRIIDDHSKAADELKTIAEKDNIILPTALDATQQAVVDRFSKMSGIAFDRAYMRDMVKDHEKDIADFQNEASMGSNMNLKNWASSTLPTLLDHLRMAKDANASLGSMSNK